jgi:hypothetical protein
LKNLFLTIGLIAGVLSCSKKDPGGNPAGSPLYGTWKSEGGTVTGCKDTALNRVTADCCAPGGLCCGTIVFTQTTMTTSGIVRTSTTNYEMSGNSFHYDSDGGVPTYFTVTDSTLTLSYQETVDNGNCLIVSTYVRN